MRFVGLRFATLLVVLGGFTSPLVASDPFAYSGSTSLPRWSGLYAGAHVGLGWGKATNASTNGLLIGGHIGHNWQHDRFVLGLEGDLTYSDVKFQGFTNSFNTEWMGSARGRLGYSYDKYLFFGTAGLGFGAKAYKDVAGADRAIGTGYVLGFGAEAQITDRVSVRGEYLHYDLGRDVYRVGPSTYTISTTVNSLRTGLSYRF